VQGRIDPRTRIRRLMAVDLWEISIVTFPLLAHARPKRDWRALLGGKAEPEMVRRRGRRC